MPGCRRIRSCGVVGAVITPPVAFFGSSASYSPGPGTVSLSFFEENWGGTKLAEGILPDLGWEGVYAPGPGAAVLYCFEVNRFESLMKPHRKPLWLKDGEEDFTSSVG